MTAGLIRATGWALVSTNERSNTMGYSASSAAFRTIERIIEEAHKLKPLNGSNTWISDDGLHYFYERGNEQPDGAMTGKVMRSFAKSEWHPSWGDYRETACKSAGSFRIEPSGKITRFPGIPKKVKALLDAEKRRIEDFDRSLRR
jgi:hypothetical protein